MGRSLIPGILLWVMVGALLAGCPPTYTDHDAFMKSPKPIVGGRPYVIEPPDRFRVLCPSIPEVHEREYSIRPDGYVTMDLLGEVFVAGKTPTQLGNELEEKLLHYYEEASVQVQVTVFGSKFYYMTGETAAGRRAYTGRDTLMDAVTGSIPRTAWPEYTILLRPNEEGHLIRRMTLDVRDLYQKGIWKHNVVLEEGDIIYVPVNPLAGVGVVFQNLLAPVDPLVELGTTPAEFGDARYDPTVGQNSTSSSGGGRRSGGGSGGGGGPPLLPGN